ncbi:type IV toxin-antitoxin system AbiEi family antitoxin domain-containing protein [Actinoplanes sp. NPDC020271]|uniref:type IV toxin-antitoxin system AbiEi family antitoxin domain-containing protein n=1 Tax=Actinoplanes sp. NPDC020271 TaxID=3363896 RepID=UPI003795553E
MTTYRLTPRNDRALTTLLDRQDGLITWQQARRQLSDKAVRHRVRTGRWRRVHHGLYLTRADDTDRQRLWTASLAAGHGHPAPLAGVTALRQFGLDGGLLPGDAPVHVLVPAGRPARHTPPDVLVHRTRRLSSVDVCPTAAPPCTTAARALVDAVEWAADGLEAMIVLGAVHHQQLVSSAQVRPVLARLPRLARRALIEETVFDGDWDLPRVT